MTRRRAEKAIADLPATVLQWFKGERPPEKRPAVPWAVLAFPGYINVVNWWQVFVANYPGSTPPRDYGWLAEPDAINRFPAHEIAAARSCAPNLKGLS